MPDVFMYANETANLDYQEHQGASTYFCVGTAAFSGNHGEALGGGLALRADLAAAGVKLRRGFHAVMRAEATITADTSAKFSSDQTAVRATMRADLLVPYPQAVVRIAGILE